MTRFWQKIFKKQGAEPETVILEKLRPLLPQDAVINAQIDAAGNAIITITCTSAGQAKALDQQSKSLTAALDNINSIQSVQILFTAERKAENSNAAPAQAPPAKTPQPLPHVKKIILVASGKGGVGKSTLTSNLAIALAEEGLNIGICDADIYGPSQPKMMGLEGQKPEGSQGHITPLQAHGVKVMSIGFMVDEKAALVWRGPIVQRALMQIMQDVEWGTAERPLDILLVDMPPGTGDIQLTLAQKTKIDGALIVSTPQDIALIDARKAIDMFRKVSVPILGLVENMSTHICTNCGHEDPIFGSGGAQEEAAKQNVPFLGKVPLSANIRLSSDNGKPAAQNAESYQEIVKKLL